MGDITALFAPHAGLMFSGPVGAYAYKAAAASQPYDVAFIVGPSHFFGFDGVAVWPDGGFDSPLGMATVDAAAASELLQHAVAHVLPQAHGREHSIEMQLPFFRRVLPDVPIVPALMGLQRRETIVALAEALAAVARGRRALLIASTDLSHYFDAKTAATLDARVQDCVRANDPDALLELFEQLSGARAWTLRRLRRRPRDCGDESGRAARCVARGGCSSTRIPAKCPAITMVSSDTSPRHSAGSTGHDGH